MIKNAKKSFFIIEKFFAKPKVPSSGSIKTSFAKLLLLINRSSISSGIDLYLEASTQQEKFRWMLYIEYTKNHRLTHQKANSGGGGGGGGVCDPAFTVLQVEDEEPKNGGADQEGRRKRRQAGGSGGGGGGSSANGAARGANGGGGGGADNGMLATTETTGMMRASDERLSDVSPIVARAAEVAARRSNATVNFLYEHLENGQIKR